MAMSKEQAARLEEERRDAAVASANRVARTLGIMVIVPVVALVVLIVTFGVLLAGNL